MTHEHLKEELAATLHALSGKPQLAITFTEPLLPERTAELAYNATAQQLDITLPKLETARDVAALRGALDGFALRLKHHDAKAFQHALRQHQNGAHRIAISGFVERMEQARVAALGGQNLTGVAMNLAEQWHRDLLQKRYDKTESLSTIPPAEVLALALFADATGITPPAGKLALEALSPLLTVKAGKDAIPNLRAHLSDITTFTHLTCQLAEHIFHEMSPTTPEGTQPLEEMQAHGQQGNGESGLPEGESAAAPTEAAGQEESAESSGEQQRTAGSESPDDTRSMGNDSADAPESETIMEEPTNATSATAYRIYTEQFDQIRHAGDLAAMDELQRHRATLDRKLSEVRDITARLATRLQRKLLAEQLRSWEYHREDGILDARTFSHLITDANYPYAYKWEHRSPYKDTVVSVLIDNSGSMRGRPIMMAAMCADILARVLERCNVKVEVLGFTTESWKGGQARQQWLKNGSPAQPGRLNDLLHVIYKQASTPWRRAHWHLGLMLREGLLKENIDGEALAWAYQRLKQRPEERKILLVISDGAPVDDSTLAVNPADFLERHLHDTVRKIEQDGTVDLLAVGIGHNVNKHYARAVTIPTVDALAEAMVTQLVPLFERGQTR